MTCMPNCFAVLSEEYKLIKANNTVGSSTLQTACRKACSKIGMSLMPLSDIDDNRWALQQVPEYRRELRQQIMTDGCELFSSQGISTFLSTPNGGEVHVVQAGFNLADPGRRLNRPGIYCIKLSAGAYISADCKKKTVRDWCGCKRGERFCHLSCLGQAFLAGKTCMHKIVAN